jgi:hypothetical protein
MLQTDRRGRIDENADEGETKYKGKERPIELTRGLSCSTVREI